MYLEQEIPVKSFFFLSFVKIWCGETFKKQNYKSFFYCIQRPVLKYISTKSRPKYLLTSPPSTLLVVLKHSRLVCELICFLAINTHFPWRCNHRLMRNVILAFKRKISSVVKIDLCTIRKLTGPNDIYNLGKINRIEQTYFF